jgi:hypothetical protein
MGQSGEAPNPPETEQRLQTDPSQLDLQQLNQDSRSLEFDVERLLEGEKSAEEGRVRPLADVLNELRARNRR